MNIKTLFSLGIIFLFSSMFASAALDLQFTTAISQTPDPASAGNIVTFTVSFRTTGGAVTNFKIIGGVDSTQLFERTYASIGADMMRTDTFNWPATAGNHTVWFVLDPDHTCGDSNYANNRIEKAVTVAGGAPAGQPDLTLTAFFFPSKPKANEDVNFDIIIYNSGNAGSKMCELQILQDGSVITTKTVPAIVPAGGKIPNLNHCHIKYPWKAVCGALIEIKVDSNNVNAESNEGNNSWSNKMKCGFTMIDHPDLSTPVYKTDPNGPDLTVKIIELYKSPYDSTGKTATVKYEVSNIGKAASVPCNMTAKRGGVDEMYFDVPTLAAGQSYTAIFAEEYVCNETTTMHIDTDNKNVEIDENNNVAKKQILCLSPSKKIINNFK
jgi:subtilase family serine protease